ncbi:MAG: protein arginine kinase [Oscillospiraceae bacterium]|nr:protein arginine kinase [Oscillospiraceae bacterium]
MKWYEIEGEMGGIVVSTRVRLARNLADYPFPAKLSSRDENEILEKVSNFLTGNEADGEAYTLTELSTADAVTAGALVEKHIISPHMAAKSGNRGVVLSEDESVSIMINEEDHLRIQVLGSGFCLDECLEKANKIDDLLDGEFTYAWSERLGYLTRCPSNLGTGLRASVMLHLPAHTESGEISMLMGSLGRLGFTVRGIYGEGTAAVGSYYQISNQFTFGSDEQDTIDRLAKVVRSTVEHEQELRDRYRDRHPNAAEDKVWRAYGVLKYARKLSSAEATALLGDIRQGVVAGDLEDVSIPLLNALLWQVQPNQVKVISGDHHMDSQERDIARAEMVRESF